MKKIIYSVLLFLGACCAFTSCEDDLDSNPTLVQPTTFVLNTPAYADEVIDLAASENMKLTWSQPDYGYPVVANYYLQLSENGNFTVSVAEAEADESKQLVADYVMADDASALCSREYPAADIAKMLQKLCKWAEADVPAVKEVYVRLLSSIPVSGGVMPAVGAITSNVVKVRVAPYYVELKDALPEMWYLIGGSIGDGKWTNDPTALGTSIVPMNTVKNFAYDKKTGEGEITFTGYFESDKGFKIIHVPGSWAEQWGQDGDFGNYRQKDADGEGSDIKVPENGYYTIKLDTKNDVLDIVKAEVTPAVYENMYITGDFCGWGETANPMTKVNTAVANNHVWSFTLDASAGATTCKFLQPGWNPNWGGAAFPYGYGENGGSNIPVGEGVWTVLFDDVTGYYTFIAK